MGYSMILGSGGEALEVKVKPFPSPRIIPALSWAQDAAGNWHATDRTESQDIYEADVVFQGTRTEMEALADWIEAHGREEFVVSVCDGPIFAPVIDHDGSPMIECTFLNLGRMRQAFFSDGSGVFELSATLRALVAPRNYYGGPSLSHAELRLQQGFEADKSTEVRKSFFYNTGAAHTDDRSDSGRFIGTFRQRTEQIREALSYLLTTVRGEAFAFPEIAGVTYPFGKAHGSFTGKQCKVKSIGLFRVNLKVWELKLEFVEEREIV